MDAASRPNPTVISSSTSRSHNPSITARNIDRSVLVFVPNVKYTNGRSEEHTSELQSRVDLVCRLLLEKKKTRAIHLAVKATPNALPRPTEKQCLLARRHLVIRKPLRSDEHSSYIQAQREHVHRLLSDR